MKIGILTVSDRATQGIYEDQSGPLIIRIISNRTNWKDILQDRVSDDIDEISSRLLSWCDDGVSLILTTGGTGFSPRDVTPEATRKILEKDAPGISEAIRAESLKITPHGMLSRAISGIRGRTLIINLPGSPKAVRESLDILLPVLPHALDLVAGAPQAETGHRAI